MPEALLIRGQAGRSEMWVQNTIEMMALEAKTPRPGSSTVITHLADILVIQAVILAVGIWLLPRGIFDKTVMKGIALAAVGGAAMAATAHLLSWLTPFVAAPISVVVYFGCLVVTGALDKDQIEKLKDAIARKLTRRKTT